MTHSLQLNAATRIRWTILVAALLTYALLIWRFWFVADDAFISFRYARNLVRGFGLRFNLDESPAVEGYSNFLWTLGCAAVEALRLDPARWVPVASISAALVILWRVYVCVRERSATAGPALLATATLAAFPPFALWSSSGLEAMGFAALVFVTFERLILRRGGADWLGGGIAALLMALIRVEGVAWGIVILAIATIVRRVDGKRCGGAILKAAAILVVGFGAYFAWRWGYYQSALPNTVYAKGELDGPRLYRGLCYVFSFALAFITPLMLLPATLVGIGRSARPVGPALAAMAWAFVAYSVLVTGDFMPMGRFLLPALPFAAVLFGGMLSELDKFGRRGLTLSACIAVATIGAGLLPAWDVHMVPESIREKFHFRHNTPSFRSELAQWTVQAQNAETWARLGRGLREYASQRGWDPGTTSYVVGAIGAVGYYSDLKILDQHGLVTPEVARQRASTERQRSPGHDKFVPVGYFAARRPRLLEAELCLAAEPLEALQTALRMRAALAREGAVAAESYHIDAARVSEIDTRRRADYVVTAVPVDAPDASRAESQRRLEMLERNEHLPIDR